MRKAVAGCCAVSFLLVALGGCAGAYKPPNMTFALSGAPSAPETVGAVSSGNTILAEAFTYDE
jgi:hypothetical protein